MKRLIVALLVGGVVFGTVWGLASGLDVGFGTAATGTGDVGSCGDVSGSTYILEGQTITTAGNDTVTGDPTDIAEFQAVNIEVDDDCDEQNAFVQVFDGENGTGTAIATGSCTIHNGDNPDIVGDNADVDGLGWDEGSTSDNVGGCTALVGTDTGGDDDLPDVFAAESLRVTIN